MTAIEIQDKRSKGNLSNRGITIYAETEPRSIGTTYMSYETVRFRSVSDGTGEANAEAIVLAVNNTFNAGIDPAKVPEMRDVLVDIASTYYDGALSKAMFTKIEKLLNEAKL